MESVGLLDRAGRRRSPATLSSFHQGRIPSSKGLRYSPDPPTVDEIIAVMRAAGDAPEGMTLRGVIIVLWRAGLWISEALALAETDLDRQRGAVLVRAGEGGRRREVGMDRWAWEQLDPWLELPVECSPSPCALPAHLGASRWTATEYRCASEAGLANAAAPGATVPRQANRSSETVGGRPNGTLSRSAASESPSRG